ncbi:MAG: hypothetical protein IT452_04205 [Planctomycetia bacterium]|nr:hypothetical protein [Planctomycetia bacterium]
MSATPDIAALRRHLRAQERASRRDAALHACQALACIRRKRFFLAVTELIEAEVAHHEAEAVKRALDAMRKA